MESNCLFEQSECLRTAKRSGILTPAQQKQVIREGLATGPPSQLFSSLVANVCYQPLLDKLRARTVVADEYQVRDCFKTPAFCDWLWSRGETRYALVVANVVLDGIYVEQQGVASFLAACLRFITAPIRWLWRRLTTVAVTETSRMRVGFDVPLASIRFTFEQDAGLRFLTQYITPEVVHCCSLSLAAMSAMLNGRMSYLTAAAFGVALETDPMFKRFSLPSGTIAVCYTMLASCCESDTAITVVQQMGAVDKLLSHSLIDRIMSVFDFKAFFTGLKNLGGMAASIVAVYKLLELAVSFVYLFCDSDPLTRAVSDIAKCATLIPTDRSLLTRERLSSMRDHHKSMVDRGRMDKEYWKLVASAAATLAHEIKVADEFEQAQPRVPALGIHIHGETGVGKSMISKLLIKEAMSVIRPEVTNPVVYSPVAGSVFDDGLTHHHRVILLDDLLVNKENAVAFFQHLFQVINITPFKAHMAQCEEKGRLSYNFDLAVVLNNEDDFPLQQVLTAEQKSAIIRRFPIRYKQSKCVMQDHPDGLHGWTFYAMTLKNGHWQPEPEPLQLCKCAASKDQYQFRAHFRASVAAYLESATDAFNFAKDSSGMSLEDFTHPEADDDVFVQQGDFDSELDGDQLDLDLDESIDMLEREDALLRSGAMTSTSSTGVDVELELGTRACEGPVVFNDLQRSRSTTRVRDMYRRRARDRNDADFDRELQSYEYAVEEEAYRLNCQNGTLHTQFWHEEYQSCSGSSSDDGSDGEETCVAYRTHRRRPRPDDIPIEDYVSLAVIDAMTPADLEAHMADMGYRLPDDYVDFLRQIHEGYDLQVGRNSTFSTIKEKIKFAMGYQPPRQHELDSFSTYGPIPRLDAELDSWPQLIAWSIKLKMFKDYVRGRVQLLKSMIENHPIVASCVALSMVGACWYLMGSRETVEVQSMLPPRMKKALVMLDAPPMRNNPGTAVSQSAFNCVKFSTVSSKSYGLFVSTTDTTYDVLMPAHVAIAGGSQYTFSSGNEDYDGTGTVLSVRRVAPDLSVVTIAKWNSKCSFPSIPRSAFVTRLVNPGESVDYCDQVGTICPPGYKGAISCIPKYKTGDYGTFTLTDFLVGSTNISTVGGDCGRVVIAADGIIGMHIARINTTGNPIAHTFSQSVVARIFDPTTQWSISNDALPTERECVRSYLVSKSIPYTNARWAVGSGGASKQAANTVLGQIVPAPNVYPSYMDVVSDGNGALYSPFVASLRNILNARELPQKQIADDIIQGYVAYLCKIAPTVFQSYTYLTVEQAFFGVSDLPGGLSLPAMELDSITGCHSLSQPAVTMRELVKDGVLNQQLIHECQLAFRLALEGKVMFSNPADLTAKACKKDETVVEKVDSQKDTRTMFASPLKLKIVMRMIYGHFIAYCHAFPITTMLGVGIDPYTQFGELAEKYVRGFLSADAKKYDQCFRSQMLADSFKVVDQLVGHKCPVMLPTLRAMVVSFDQIAVSDLLFLWSGLTMTSIIGGIGGNLTTASIVKQYNPTWESDRVFAELHDRGNIRYGDDVAIGLADGEENICGVTDWAAGFKQFGFTYTDALKNGGPVVVPLSHEGAMFLGRSFVKRDGIWRCPLRLESFANIPVYRRKPMTENQYLTSIIPTLRLEAREHGESMVDRVEVLLEQWCATLHVPYVKGDEQEVDFTLQMDGMKQDTTVGATEQAVSSGAIASTSDSVSLVSTGKKVVFLDGIHLAGPKIRESQPMKDGDFARLHQVIGSHQVGPDTSLSSTVTYLATPFRFFSLPESRTLLSPCMSMFSGHRRWDADSFDFTILFANSPMVSGVVRVGWLPCTPSMTTSNSKNRRMYLHHADVDLSVQRELKVSFPAVKPMNEGACVLPHPNLSYNQYTETSTQYAAFSCMGMLVFEMIQPIRYFGEPAGSADAQKITITVLMQTNGFRVSENVDYCTYSLQGDSDSIKDLWTDYTSGDLTTWQAFSPLLLIQQDANFRDFYLDRHAWFDCDEVEIELTVRGSRNLNGAILVWFLPNGGTWTPSQVGDAMGSTTVGMAGELLGHFYASDSRTYTFRIPSGMINRLIRTANGAFSADCHALGLQCLDGVVDPYVSGDTLNVRARFRLIDPTTGPNFYTAQVGGLEIPSAFDWNETYADEYNGGVADIGADGVMVNGILQHDAEIQPLAFDRMTPLSVWMQRSPRYLALAHCARFTGMCHITVCTRGVLRPNCIFVRGTQELAGAASGTDVRASIQWSRTVNSRANSQRYATIGYRGFTPGSSTYNVVDTYRPRNGVSRPVNIYKDTTFSLRCDLLDSPVIIPRKWSDIPAYVQGIETLFVSTTTAPATSATTTPAGSLAPYVCVLATVNTSYLVSHEINVMYWAPCFSCNLYVPWSEWPIDIPLSLA